MDINRLMLLSGQAPLEHPEIVKESDEVQSVAKELWADKVLGLDEVFIDYEDLYSYVTSELNIDNSKLMSVKGVIDEFTKAFNDKSDDPDNIGLDISKGGDEARLALNKGIEQLEGGDYSNGIELLIIGYQKATAALIDKSEFMDEYSYEIEDTLSYRDNPNKYHGVGNSDFM